MCVILQDCAGKIDLLPWKSLNNNKAGPKQLQMSQNLFWLPCWFTEFTEGNSVMLIFSCKL